MTRSSTSTMTVYRNSNSPYANSNPQIAAPTTPAVSAFTDNNSEINHDFIKRSRSATIISAATQSLAPCDAVSAILPAVPESHHSPELELAKTSTLEHDGLQPLSTYCIPHEYVDVNGVKNKGFAPVAPGMLGQSLLKLSPADGQIRICGLKRSMFVVFLVLLAITIGLGVGLGAGLGLGLKQQSSSKNSSTGGLTAACPAASPTSTSTSSDNANNSNSPTSSTTTSSSSSAPSASSTSTGSAVAGGIDHLTCPSFNGTIISSPLSPSSSSAGSSSSSPSSTNNRSPPNKKYMILCDANLAPAPSKQDLASFNAKTLEECFAVCDSMNFYMKREDVSAVWNYAYGKGPGRGGCWCVGKREGVTDTSGRGNLELQLEENKGVSVVVVGVDEAGGDFAVSGRGWGGEGREMGRDDGRI